MVDATLVSLAEQRRWIRSRWCGSGASYAGEERSGVNSKVFAPRRGDTQRGQVELRPVVSGGGGDRVDSRREGA